GSVVDLIAFRNESFTQEIIQTAQTVSELGDIRFIRPELLLVTHLLRPGTTAALAAVELVLARRAAGDFDYAMAQQWAAAVDRKVAMDLTIARADELANG